MRVATIVTNGDARRDGGAGEALNHKAAEKMTRRLTTTRHQSAAPEQIPALGIGTRSLCGYGLACGGGVNRRELLAASSRGRCTLSPFGTINNRTNYFCVVIRPEEAPWSGKAITRNCSSVAAG
jgi:hypothetical protein